MFVVNKAKTTPTQYFTFFDLLNEPLARVQQDIPCCMLSILVMAMNDQLKRIGVKSTTPATLLDFVLVYKLSISLYTFPLTSRRVLDAGFAALPLNPFTGIRYIYPYRSAM